MAHHGVVLHEVVLHRCAGEDEAAAGAHATQRLVQLALHVLDAVALVEHDQVGPRVLQQRRRLAPGLVRVESVVRVRVRVRRGLGLGSGLGFRLTLPLSSASIAS